MKKIILSAALLAMAGLMTISADAAWKCKLHNAKGQVWYGTGPTRAAASANAMKFCSNNSTYAKNCVVNWCRSGF